MPFSGVLPATLAARVLYVGGKAAYTHRVNVANGLPCSREA